MKQTNKEDLITDDFLKKNLFEQAKIGCGYFPWYFSVKDYEIYIAPRTDSLRSIISVSNYTTKNNLTLEYRAPNRPLKSDLQWMLEKMGIEDEFDYK